MKKLPKGLWPVMLTPFKNDNSIDIDGLKILTEFYIAAGADGLFANCLSSEMFQLTDEERLLVTKTVIDTANSRIPVIATGSFSYEISSSALFIKKLNDLGVAATVISTSQPCNEFETDDVFRLTMENLMNRTKNIPLGLYECPVPYKRLIPTDTLKWLAESGRFYYHKDTSCNIETIKERIKAVKGTNLGIYNAHVPTGVESIRYGARGLSPIAANLYPELFSYLLKNINDQSKQEKIENLNNVLDIMDTIIHYNYPFTAKIFLQNRGLDIKENGRIPRFTMNVHDYNKLDTIMKEFRKLSEELAINMIQFKPRETMLSK